MLEEEVLEHATVPKLNAAKYAPPTVTVLMGVLVLLTVNNSVAVTLAAPLAVLDSVTLLEVSALVLMAGNATLD